MNMKKSEIITKVKSVIRDHIESKGFKVKRTTSFIRTEDDAQQIIGFSVYKARDNTFRIQLGVRVRFPIIEKILNIGENDESDSTLNGTYGGLIHLIMGRPFLEWICVSEADLHSISKDLIEHIDNYCLPFLNKHKNLETVKEKLLSENPKDWLTFDGITRINTLGAILWSQGFYSEAKELLENYLREMEGKLPKYWLNTKELLDYLCR